MVDISLSGTSSSTVSNPDYSRSVVTIVAVLSKAETSELVSSLKEPHFL